MGKSIIAAGADTATTAIAIAHRATELNPLGVMGAFAMKPVVIWFASRQPKEDQAEWFSGTASAWSGAAANNLCVLVGGGIGCIAVGIATAVALWSQSSEEREFWHMCKMEKLRDPKLECIYSPSKASSAANPA